MTVIISGSAGIQNPLGSAAAPSESNTTNSNTGAYFPTGTTYGIATNGSNAMYIDASQNVGIGTTSPAVKLDLYNGGSQLKLGMTATGNGFAITNDPAYTLFQTANAVYMAFGTNGSERMRIDSSGNVGIGITPNAWSGFTALQMAGPAMWGSSGLGHWSVNTYYDGTNYKYISTNYATDYYQLNGTHVWRYAPSGTAGTNVTSFNEAMRIDSSGNLLIANTTAAENAGIGVKAFASGEVSVVSATSTGAQSGFTMYSTGAGAFRFFVTYAGSVNATSTSITAISDQSLKTNIRPLETGITEIMRLKPRRFDWKEETQIGETNVAGFIAQEVQEVLPELVYDYKYNESETKLGLKMGDMLPTIVAAMQEQQKIIQELSAEVAALKAKVGA